MKTPTLALVTALIASPASIFAQPANPAPNAPADPPNAESPRGPGAPGVAPMPRREGTRPMPARNMPNQPQPHGPDPFAENFFPPELIMHNQNALNLSDEQRKRIIEVIQKSQPQFTDLQWQLEAEQGRLTSLFRAERPDEKQVTAQLDKVLRLEADMKRGQLMMLVRLKNELTAEQQAKLRAMTRNGWQPR